MPFLEKRSAGEKPGGTLLRFVSSTQSITGVRLTDSGIPDRKNLRRGTWRRK